MFNSSINKDKHHYFIGNIFNNPSQIILLKNIQKKLKKKYHLKDVHWNNKLFTNMIYLGYFEQSTADLYMNNIINHLLNPLSNKISELNCHYTSYKLDYDKSFYKISLKFEDEENLLERIIIPYLHQNAILPIYEKKTNILKPSIDLIYYKHSKIIGDKKDAIKIQVPTDTFKIDHIALIKGTPIKLRSGTPSLHDQMTLEEVSNFYFPLQKNSDNIL
jgi:hypothetical protein